jgi:MFS family permease
LIGPALSTYTRGAASPEFIASYASLIVFSLLTMLVVSQLAIPDAAPDRSAAAPRPMKEIAAQPMFIVAVTTSAIGYGVMSLLMTATPLAMGFCGHPYGAAAGVISAHVIAMFAPAFFTGALIARFGVFTVIATGIVIEAGCVAIALSGIDVAHFWWALVLLGLGWNFMFVGGSALLTETYRSNEKAKAQGAHDFLVFCVTAMSSFTSGVLVNTAGWTTLQWTATPFLVICAVALAFGWSKHRRASQASAAR